MWSFSYLYLHEALQDINEKSETTYRVKVTPEAFQYFKDTAEAVRKNYKASLYEAL